MNRLLTLALLTLVIITASCRRKHTCRCNKLDDNFRPYTTKEYTLYGTRGKAVDECYKIKEDSNTNTMTVGNCSLTR